MKTIISVDGGGIKGIVAITVLQAIQNKLPKPIHEYVDCFAGTSTGGLIAAGLTVPNESGKPKFTTDDLVEVYQTLGPDVFNRSLWHKIKTLWGLVGPKFPLDGLDRVSEDKFGSIKLKECLTHVVIATYDLVTRSPVVFDSTNPDLNNTSVKDATLGTASVPTMFPSVRSGGYNLIDGGIFAVSPALCALSVCKEKYPGESFMVISIGNGDYSESLPHDETSAWGLLNWGSTAVDVILDGIGDGVDQQAKVFTETSGGPYHRLQFNIPKEFSAMDNPSPENVNGLREKTLEYIKNNEESIDKICQQLVLIDSEKRR
jgi:uncharacterized protein